MSKKEIIITHDEWLHEIFRLPQKPEGAFTIPEIVKATGISRSAAQNRADAMVARGEAKKGVCVINGKTTNYYLPVKKKK